MSTTLTFRSAAAWDTVEELSAAAAHAKAASSSTDPLEDVSSGQCLLHAPQPEAAACRWWCGGGTGCWHVDTPPVLLGARSYQPAVFSLFLPQKRVNEYCEENPAEPECRVCELPRLCAVQAGRHCLWALVMSTKAVAHCRCSCPTRLQTTSKRDVLTDAPSLAQLTAWLLKTSILAKPGWRVLAAERSKSCSAL